jgi:pilin isopeptide linkage protein/LPXTG-motif cell wall-anchored protein
VGSPDLEYVGEFTPVIDSGNPQAGAAVLITGLEKGQLYYLEETTVPEGYQKAEGEYFIIPDRENGIGVPDGAISIENAGTPHVVENIKNSGTLKLTKDVNGRESGSDFETDFYFTVYGGDRYYDRDGSYADLRTVKLHYDSRIADNSLILSLPIGEYVVKEVADAEGTPINGDNFYYNVQINGEDRNEAVIAIEKEQQAECLVKNLYEADGNLQFTAMKTMEGRPLEEGEFTFRIYEGDTLKAEAQNGLNGVILFPEINYKANDAGRHTYTIMEQKGTLTGVDYDDTVYTVTVEVTDNHDRTVSAEIVNIQRSDGAEAEVIQFNNVYYENPETTPDPSPNPNPNPSPSPGGSTGGGGGTSNTGGGRYQPSDGGPGVTISITPEEVPMAQIPSQPDSLITILDDDVPLAPLPKTGDMSVDHYMLTVISMLLTGIYLALTKRKKE